MPWLPPGALLPRQMPLSLDPPLKIWNGGGLPGSQGTPSEALSLLSVMGALHNASLLCRDFHTEHISSPHSTRPPRGPAGKQWHPDLLSEDWPHCPVLSPPGHLASCPPFPALPLPPSFLAVNLPFLVVTLLTHQHPHSPTQLS